MTELKEQPSGHCRRIRFAGDSRSCLTRRSFFAKMMPAGTTTDGPLVK